LARWTEIQHEDISSRWVDQQARHRQFFNVRCFLVLMVFLLVALITASVSAGPPIARFKSVLGDFDVLLDPVAAPISVTNFTAYANRGDYTGTFIHRSTTYNPATIQVVQGGGFFVSNNTLTNNIRAQAPIVLETNRSNVRGTIAMARTSLPNSATSQWFFNLIDNTPLDPGTPTGGYAVFGDVLGQGMKVVDRIGSALVYNVSNQYGPAFSELPLVDGNRLIIFPEIRVEPFVITNVTRTANTSELRWTALSTNTPVRVERTTDLAGEPWTTIASNNTTGAFTDTNAPARGAFYRLVTE
jgi:cyclophilin family peptidyl-prolyl cis-trans isomerase